MSDSLLAISERFGAVAYISGMICALEQQEDQVILLIRCQCPGFRKFQLAHNLKYNKQLIVLQAYTD